MKKLLIVNNNMKIGGVQKSLYNLLWSISDQYDITLFLFAPIGEYMDNLPERVHVCSCDSLFRYLGVGQRECANNLHDRLIRGFLACICKLLGRSAVMPLLLCSQKPLPAYYDCAISYLHNGNPTHFYGGVNEFVLKKTNAARRIAFLHCDYLKCGANHRENNDAYRAFDLIAACSDGCRRSFVQAMPELSAKCMTVPNFHRCDEIRNLAKQQTYVYASEFLHVIMVGRLAHTVDTANTHGIVLRGGRVRRLMPRECFRLQGFDEDQIDKILAINSDAQAYKQAGNGVTVTVIEAIGRRIRAADAELHDKEEGRDVCPTM